MSMKVYAHGFVILRIYYHSTRQAMITQWSN